MGGMSRPRFLICVLPSLSENGVCVCSQGLKRLTADSTAVRLGALTHPPQAQLDGFKSRALRAAAQQLVQQRHLYVTEWRKLDTSEAEDSGMKVLVLGDVDLPDGFGQMAANATHAEIATRLGGGEFAVVAAAAATQHGAVALAPLYALEVAFALVKAQAEAYLSPWPTIINLKKRGWKFQAPWLQEP